MNAMHAPAFTEQFRTDRDAAVREVLTCTAGLHGLPHQAERDIRAAVMRHVDPILDLADAAVAARLELEAIERRLDTHVREMHPDCSANRDCLTYRVQQIRRKRLQQQYDVAFVALLKGHR